MATGTMCCPASISARRTIPIPGAASSSPCATAIAKAAIAGCSRADLVYSFENLEGQDPKAPTQYIPVGLAVGSQTNLLFTTDQMVKEGGGKLQRVIPVHEEGLRDRFPSRINDHGLRVTELCLADGQRSLVS